MKGASSWLSAVPLASENFSLNKQEFTDAICLRYRWDLKRLPIKCPCGKTYSVDHALTCQKGGFVIQRHDRVRDLFGKLLSEVKKDVSIEPHLVPLSGEQLNRGANLSDEARLDVSARGFWRDAQRAFFDVMVFNPFAPSHTQTSLQKAFEDIEKTKKRHYNQRVIQVEHGTFTPLFYTLRRGRKGSRPLPEISGRTTCCQTRCPYFCNDQLGQDKTIIRTCESSFAVCKRD